jgi:hypothetical protein
MPRLTKGAVFYGGGEFGRVRNSEGSGILRVTERGKRIGRLSAREK